MGIDDSVRSLDDLYFPPASALLPSDTIAVSFQSDGLPTIKRFWARGWSPPITERMYDSLRALGLRRKDIVPPWYADAFVRRTIASVVIVGTINPVALLDTLISYKHQAFNLGWITNKGILNAASKSTAATPRRPRTSLRHSSTKSKPKRRNTSPERRMRC